MEVDDDDVSPPVTEVRLRILGLGRVMGREHARRRARRERTIRERRSVRAVAMHPVEGTRAARVGSKNSATPLRWSAQSDVDKSRLDGGSGYAAFRALTPGVSPRGRREGVAERVSPRGVAEGCEERGEREGGR